MAALTMKVEAIGEQRRRNEADLAEQLQERVRKLGERVHETWRHSHEAVAGSRRLSTRSRLLHAFLRPFHEDADSLVVVCAWCGRVRVEGEWVEPGEFLSGGLPYRLRRRSSHGICSDCLDALGGPKH